MPYHRFNVTVKMGSHSIGDVLAKKAEKRYLFNVRNPSASCKYAAQSESASAQATDKTTPVGVSDRSDPVSAFQPSRLFFEGR